MSKIDEQWLLLIAKILNHRPSYGVWEASRAHSKGSLSSQTSITRNVAGTKDGLKWFLLLSYEYFEVLSRKIGSLTY